MASHTWQVAIRSMIICISFFPPAKIPCKNIVLYQASIKLTNHNYHNNMNNEQVLTNTTWTPISYHPAIILVYPSKILKRNFLYKSLTKWLQENRKAKGPMSGLYTNVSQAALGLHFTPFEEYIHHLSYQPLVHGMVNFWNIIISPFIFCMITNSRWPTSIMITGSSSHSWVHSKNVTLMHFIWCSVICYEVMRCNGMRSYEFVMRYGWLRCWFALLQNLPVLQKIASHYKALARNYKLQDKSWS